MEEDPVPAGNPSLLQACRIARSAIPT